MLQSNRGAASEVESNIYSKCKIKFILLNSANIISNIKSDWNTVFWEKSNGRPSGVEDILLIIIKLNG